MNFYFIDTYEFCAITSANHVVRRPKML